MFIKIAKVVWTLRSL